MTGIPGFDFETFPASVSQAHMANELCQQCERPGWRRDYGKQRFWGKYFSTRRRKEGSEFPLNADLAGLSAHQGTSDECYQ